MTEFNTPSHYVLSDGSDSMDALAKILGPEEFKGFLRGNAIKYLIRYALKGGVNDLYKAEDYVARLAAKVEAEGKETESGHSHDIKISAHCYVEKNEEEEDDGEGLSRK